MIKFEIVPFEDKLGISYKYELNRTNQISVVPKIAKIGPFFLTLLALAAERLGRLWLNLTWYFLRFNWSFPINLNEIGLTKFQWFPKRPKLALFLALAVEGLTFLKFRLR